MSGGSHSYIFLKIEDELVGQMEDPELDDLMQDVANLAHDLEWADSGDYSKDQYFKTVAEFRKKWFDTSRNERLKDYIDKELHEQKMKLYRLIGKNE
ncbi:MAG: hypothetical protein IJ192_13285 [Clostridia bacterium]|nr:hypothetical protein [Clostridia bacterium]MBR2177442.1 hypothetical protein [Clostridia bacterium]